MGSQNGTKKNVLAKMNEDSKQLWSVPEMMAEFPDSNYKAIDNVMRNLRVSGVIDRHLDKDVNGDFQFAVKVKIEKIDVWVKSTTMGQGNVNNSTVKKKKRGQLLSSKEIRSMFAAHYNNMAKLEDSCMAIIERSEMTEKEMAKIRNFLKA